MRIKIRDDFGKRGKGRGACGSVNGVASGILMSLAIDVGWKI